MHSVQNDLVYDTATLDIIHIGTATNEMWRNAADTNLCAIPLSSNTYPTNGIQVWSDPPGIDALNFMACTCTAGVYQVYLTHGACGVAQVTVKLLHVDLDIDTFNIAKFAIPERTIEEDQSEDITDKRLFGKHIATNLSDKDGDGIPDYADGYNLDSCVGNADDTVTNELFVPLVLELKAPIDLTAAKIRFRYSGSNPAQATTNAPAEGSIRIWRKPGNKARTLADYVVPDQLYAGAYFGFTGSKGLSTNYVEGIAASAVWGDVAITVEVEPDVTDAFDIMVTDRVRATVFHAAYIVYTVMPYRYDAKITNRWYATLDTSTPHMYVLDFLEGLEFADPLNASSGWHGGSNENDPDNLYGHVFSQIIYNGPSIGLTGRYYGKSGTPGLFPIGAFNALQDGNIWWYGINGLQNTQSYCATFSANQNQIRRGRNDAEMIKLVQRHRWFFADIVTVERVRDLCEQYHAINNPDGTHYERYGLDVDTINC